MSWYKRFIGWFREVFCNDKVELELNDRIAQLSRVIDLRDASINELTSELTSAIQEKEISDERIVLLTNNIKHLEDQLKDALKPLPCCEPEISEDMYQTLLKNAECDKNKIIRDADAKYIKLKTAYEADVKDLKNRITRMSEQHRNEMSKLSKEAASAILKASVEGGEKTAANLIKKDVLGINPIATELKERQNANSLTKKTPCVETPSPEEKLLDTVAKITVKKRAKIDAATKKDIFKYWVDRNRVDSSRVLADKFQVSKTTVQRAINAGLAEEEKANKK